MHDLSGSVRIRMRDDEGLKFKSTWHLYCINCLFCQKRTNRSQDFPDVSFWCTLICYLIYNAACILFSQMPPWLMTFQFLRCHWAMLEQNVLETTGGSYFLVAVDWNSVYIYIYIWLLVSPCTTPSKTLFTEPSLCLCVLLAQEHWHHLFTLP